MKIATFFFQFLFVLSLAYSAEIMHIGAESDTLDVSGEGIKFSDSAFSGKKAYFCPRRVELRTKAFTVNPNAYYVISAWVKTTDPLPCHMYLGLIPLAANQKYIAHQHFSGNFDQVTELAKPASKGDKSITVKSAAKWRGTRYNVAAFNAAKDGSDLPNYDTSSGIVSIKRNAKAGDVITFSKPLARNYPVGTLVREHQLGGYLYLKKGVIAPGAWVRWISPKIKGSSIRKAAQAKVILVINLADKYKNRGLLVDDIKVEEFSE